MNPVFEKLIAPIQFEEFISQYWERKPIFVDGRSARHFDDIISIEDIDSFLRRTDIRHPSLRLVKDGSELPLENYTRELRLASHSSHDLIDNEKLFVLFQSGATIVLQFLQHNIPQFASFTNELEELFNCNVHGSCFITPPNAQGFTAHYDTYSFFVLQIYGEKIWNIYDRTKLPPIREDRDTDEARQSQPPTQKLKLRVGDFLYVPRGFYHDAETTNDASIHMTLGFFLPNWIDVIKAALIELYSLESLRSSPSLLGGKKPGQEFDSEIREVMRVLTQKLDLRRGVDRLQAEYFARRVDTRSRRLVDSIQATKMTTATRLRVQPDLIFKLQKRNEAQKLELSFADKKLLYPLFVEKIIRRMIFQKVFSVESLATDMDHKSLLTISQQLLREGFLTTE